MHWRNMISALHPDHDWTEADFQTMDDIDEEGPPPSLSAEDRTQRDFEKLYAKFLRNPEVRAMSAVDSLTCFLDRYPHFRVGQPL